MKKKKGLRILAFVLAAGLIALIAWIYTSFNGNFISAMIATSKIRAYVSEQYPAEDFQVPRASYNFKDGSYSSFIQSEKSEDTNFYVSVRGDELYDSYPNMVSNRFNTLTRLEKELDDLVEEIIKNEFPYDSRLVLATMSGHSEEEMKQKLTLDMAFDAKKLPLSGELTVWCSTDDFSYETAAKRLLEMKALMMKHGIDVSTYSLRLEHVYHEENGEKTPEDMSEDLNVSDVPAELLTESGDLPTLLQEHQKQWEEEMERLKNNGEQEAQSSPQT